VPIVKDKSLLSCWPDGFSRYYSVSQVIKAVFDKKPVDILDVGGDSKWMYLFLKDTGLNFNLRIVDTRAPDFVNPKVEYTKADFFKLDSEKFSAEAVINTDVLEHIPAELKLPFIDHCIRFSKSLTIFSAPQEDEDVSLSERTINSLTEAATGKQQRWLKEHFKFGKPDFQIIEKAIEKEGLPYIVLNTNSLENWLLSFAANFINQSVSPIPNMDELNRYYNANIGAVGDFAGKPYRKLFIVFKDPELYKRALPKIQSIFKPDSSKQFAFTNLVIKAMAEKALELKHQEQRVKELSLDLDKASETIRGYESRVEELSGELQDIRAKRWFRYINKLDSLLHRVRRIANRIAKPRQ